MINEKNHANIYKTLILILLTACGLIFSPNILAYDNTDLGWWYKKEWWGGHTYSTSWQNSNIFARYMGVDYWTNDHYDFTTHIQRGDFIAIDGTRNGK